MKSYQNQAIPQPPKLNQSWSTADPVQLEDQATGEVSSQLRDQAIQIKELSEAIGCLYNTLAPVMRGPLPTNANPAAEQQSGPSTEVGRRLLENNIGVYEARNAIVDIIERVSI